LESDKSGIIKGLVFQNQEFGEVTDILKTCPTDLLYHGNKSRDFIDKFTLSKIKVFSIQSEFNTNLILPIEDEVDFFLLDSDAGNDLGGIGKIFDWL
jgi:phosphoribosylanthranilate isomerase